MRRKVLGTCHCWYPVSVPQTCVYSTSRLRRRRGWAYAGQQQQMCGLQSIIGAGRVIRLKLTFNLPASQQLGAQPFITSLTLWCTTPGCGGCRGCAYPVVRLVRYGTAFLVIPTSLVIRHFNWEPKAFSTEGWLWYRTKPTTSRLLWLDFILKSYHSSISDKYFRFSQKYIVNAIL